MKSSLEPLEGNKVKLYVEVEEDEVETEINKAFKAIAKEVRLPGFRNGKAPRRVLEARIGIGAAREEAVRTAVPEYLAKAVREHDVDLIATPEIDITDGQESGPLEFDATCEIRPVVTVPGYGGLRVELPSLEVTDDDLQSARDAELRKAGELVDVDRPAAVGDFVTLNLAATRDGEEVPGLNTEDWSYEVGQGWVSDDFDDQLVGASVGDELRFTTTPKATSEEADFVVKVGAVQEMQLPELTDEWVDENLAEHDTVEAWEAGLREQIEQAKIGQARQQLVDKVTAALGELVDVEPPEAMVDSEINRQMQGLMQQFQQQGIDFAQWATATGQDPEQLRDSMRPRAEQAVKTDLALRAVAEAEAIEVEGPELDAEYARMAMQFGQKAKEVRKVYERNDAVPELVSQMRKSKALDWLMHNVEYVDEHGAEIDRDTLLGHTHDDIDDPDAAVDVADDVDDSDAPDAADDTPRPPSEESDES